MIDPIFYWKILLVLALVFTNGFFVAAEFALVRLRSGEVKLMVRSGSKTATIVELILKRLDAYLSACQLGITLASLALGWVGEPVVAKLLEPLFHLFNLPKQSVHLFALPIAFVIITFRRREFAVVWKYEWLYPHFPPSDSDDLLR